ncbi:MAG: hypothetical protein ACXWNR_03550 [Candidatus Limnocylindrales bacterium]
MPDPSNDHNRILRDACRDVLVPLGLIQKGRSRIWLDDHRWHVTVVEFQPSSWSKGSYLNVGVMWLWFAKDYLSFDLGHRVRGMESAESGDWASRVRALAQSAATRVKAIRDEIPDVSAAARVLMDDAEGPWWPQFHAAVAVGLAGDVVRSERLCADLLRLEARHDWQQALHARVHDLQVHLGDERAFRAYVTGEIQQCRLALKLAPLPDQEIEGSLRASQKPTSTETSRSP